MQIKITLCVVFGALFCFAPIAHASSASKSPTRSNKVQIQLNARKTVAPSFSKLYMSNQLNGIGVTARYLEKDNLYSLTYSQRQAAALDDSQVKGSLKLRTISAAAGKTVSLQQLTGVSDLKSWSLLGLGGLKYGKNEFALSDELSQSVGNSSHNAIFAHGSINWSPANHWRIELAHQVERLNLTVDIGGSKTFSYNEYIQSAIIGGSYEI